MQFYQWSDRLIQFTWTDLIPYSTHSLVYLGMEFTFVIDTFLGPGKMSEMLASPPLKNHSPSFIVINTHYHFDHIWGNQAFSESLRIATPLCRDLIQQHFEKDKKDNYALWEEGNQLCLPNCLITAPLFFPEDQIEIFPSPGHSEDGCSVMFHREKLLAVGDNLERPIPFLENSQWKEYLQTLDRYETLQPATIIPGHGQADSSDIQRTREYIQDWQKQNLSHYNQGITQEVHQQNVRFLFG